MASKGKKGKNTSKTRPSKANKSNESEVPDFSTDSKTKKTDEISMPGIAEQTRGAECTLVGNAERNICKKKQTSQNGTAVSTAGGLNLKNLEEFKESSRSFWNKGNSKASKTKKIQVSIPSATADKPCHAERTFTDNAEGKGRVERNIGKNKQTIKNRTAFSTTTSDQTVKPLEAYDEASQCLGSDNQESRPSVTFAEHLVEDWKPITDLVFGDDQGSADQPRKEVRSEMKKTGNITDIVVTTPPTFTKRITLKSGEPVTVIDHQDGANSSGENRSSTITFQLNRSEVASEDANQESKIPPSASYNEDKPFDVRPKTLQHSIQSKSKTNPQMTSKVQEAKKFKPQAPVGIAYSKITGVDTEDLTLLYGDSMLSLKSHAKAYAKGIIDRQSRSSSQGTQTRMTASQSTSKSEKSTSTDKPSGPETDQSNRDKQQSEYFAAFFADDPHNVDISTFTRPADIANVSCFDDNVVSFYDPNIAVMFSIAVETYTTDLCQTFIYVARNVKTFKTSVMQECVFEGAMKADKWYHFIQEFVYITMALEYQADIAAERKTRDVYFDVMKVRNKYKLAKIAEKVDRLSRSRALDVDRLSRALGIDSLSPQVMNPVVQFCRDLTSKDYKYPGKCYVPLLDIKIRIQRYVGRLVWLLIDFFLHLTEKAGVPNAGLKKANKSSYKGSKPGNEENGENAHDNTASKQDESNSPTEKTSAQARPSASENCQEGHCDSSDPLTDDEETAVYNEMTQDFLEILAHWFQKMALMSIEFLRGLERGTQIAIDSSLKAKILQLLHVSVLTPPQFSM